MASCPCPVNPDLSIVSKSFSDDSLEFDWPWPALESTLITYAGQVNPVKIVSCVSFSLRWCQDLVFSPTWPVGWLAKGLDLLAGP